VRAWNDLFDYEGQEVRQRCFPSGWGFKAPEKHEARLDKSRVLRTHLVMEATRVVPSDGSTKKEQVDRPLREIAAAAGYRHASSYARALKRCPRLTTSQPHWGSPTHREWAFEASSRSRGNRAWKGHNMPSSRELSKHPTLGKYFRNSGGGGYHNRPGFIYTKSFPGTPNDKVVLSKIAELGAFSKGLLEDATQRYLCSETGLSPDTICSILRKYSIYTRKIFERNAEGKLRAKKVVDPETGEIMTLRIEERGEFPLFRIINRPARYMKDGRALDKWEPGAELKQPPNKIVYIGDRMLDARTGVLETQRLLAIAEAQRMTSELWWQHVARVHGELLSEYIGTERHQRSLWEACSVRLQVEASINGRGVPGKALDLLFPKSRPPD
jgi:hypothetical protein